VDVFANFVVPAVVVFVAGGAASFLVVYQKTSADDRALLLHIFLLLGLRLLKYLTSTKRLLCPLGLRFLFHLVWLPSSISMFYLLCPMLTGVDVCERAT
jgi:hypothetical protein